MIIRFNGWQGAYPDCPFVQLTLLSEHVDAQEVSINNQKTDSNDTTDNN